MYTLGDHIISLAKSMQGGYSTDEGMRLLEIKNIPDNYTAGNMFMAALSIIKKLLEEKEEKGK